MRFSLTFSHGKGTAIVSREAFSKESKNTHFLVFSNSHGVQQRFCWFGAVWSSISIMLSQNTSKFERLPSEGKNRTQHEGQLILFWLDILKRVEISTLWHFPWNYKTEKSSRECWSFFQKVTHLGTSRSPLPSRRSDGQARTKRIH